ncbi:FixH family protein [Jannaschia marina]|uniref:FixH family protein n=1 Tax=Jannaschia marina TaxID=2741674 RepID=UPI0015C8AAC7|nr:FixH family protein [Jannaschia marina]
MTTETGKGLTGRRVAALFVGGFAIIIGANVTLAVNAVRSFPGIETKNVYVVSQHFEAARKAQDALGWDVDATWTDGTLRLAVADAEGPVRPRIDHATFGRATTTADDVAPAFDWDGTAWRAPVDARAGNWNLRVEMTAPDGTPFRRRIPVRVPR